jgi:transcriptional regulator with PAS, ATPase and Fis domain
MVEKGQFRQDLLYRINTIEIHIPPLRERGDDVVLLAEYFLKKYAQKYKKDIQSLTREATQKLMRYSWPGNVRELQHAIERSVILSKQCWLKPSDSMLTPKSERKSEQAEILNLDELELRAIKRALKLCQGNVSEAAELLGITRYALYRKMSKNEL